MTSAMQEIEKNLEVRGIILKLIIGRWGSSERRFGWSIADRWVSRDWAQTCHRCTL